MAAQDLFHQLGLEGSVFATAEDLARFIAAPGRGQSEGDYVGELARQYRRGDFLPIYATEYITRLAILHSQCYLMDEDYRVRMEEINKCLTHEQERHSNDVYAARMLMRRALSLFEVLQDGREVGEKDLGLLGVSCSPSEDGAVDYAMRLHIPQGDYLEYINESVSFIRSQRTLFFDFFIEEETDPYIGYLGRIDGANLIIAHSATNDASGRKSFLIYALSTLIDLHFVHVRPLAVGIGDYRLFSFDELSALWVRLRESAAGGRVGVCRTCGAPFIADNERRYRRAYCSDSCKRKYLRTTKVLRDIEGGKDPKQAARDNSISINAVADIAKRNGLLKEDADYGFDHMGGDQR